MHESARSAQPSSRPGDRRRDSALIAAVSVRIEREERRTTLPLKVAKGCSSTLLRYLKVEKRVLKHPKTSCKTTRSHPFLPGLLTKARSATTEDVLRSGTPAKRSGGRRSRTGSTSSDHFHRMRYLCRSFAAFFFFDSGSVWCRCQLARLSAFSAPCLLHRENPGTAPASGSSSSVLAAPSLVRAASS
jgi:hypothetical protein